MAGPSRIHGRVRGQGDQRRGQQIQRVDGVRDLRACNVDMHLVRRRRGEVPPGLAGGLRQISIAPFRRHQRRRGPGARLNPESQHSHSHLVRDLCHLPEQTVGALRELPEIFVRSQDQLHGRASHFDLNRPAGAGQCDDHRARLWVVVAGLEATFRQQRFPEPEDVSGPPVRIHQGELRLPPDHPQRAKCLSEAGGVLPCQDGDGVLPAPHQKEGYCEAWGTRRSRRWLVRCPCALRWKRFSSKFKMSCCSASKGSRPRSTPWSC